MMSLTHNISNDRADVHYGLNIVKYSFKQNTIDIY